jgi:hypothetical protein
MDQSIASTVDCNDRILEWALCVDIAAQALKAFEAEHNDATDPRNEHVQTKEESAVGLPVDSAFLTTTAPTLDFPLFPKLPAELRLMIWREARPGPRLVDVKFRFEDKYSRFGSTPTHCTSRTPPPAMLGVCRESREEALKKYSLCFAMDSGRAKIYFDLEVDNLFITCDDPMDLLASLHVAGGLAMPSFQGLRHLALALCPGMMDVDLRGIVYLIEHLQGLETFTLLPHENRDCCIAWRGVVLREVETDKEPEGYRERFADAMDAEAYWMPGIWREALALKFMGICEAADPPSS